MIVSRGDTEGLVRGFLFRAGLQQQRCGQGQAAEADIGDVGPPSELDAQQHVAARGDGIFRLAPKHARGKAADLEAKRFQRMHN